MAEGSVTLGMGSPVTYNPFPKFYKFYLKDTTIATVSTELYTTSIEAYLLFLDVPTWFALSLSDQRKV